MTQAALSALSGFETSAFAPNFGLTVHAEPGDVGLLRGIDIAQATVRHGLIIFRGLKATREQFEDFSKQATPTFMIHVGLGREAISEDETTQTVAKGMHYLPAHIERGYAPPVPRFVFFYCARPADNGGETTVYDGFDVLAALTPPTRDFLRKAKLHWLLRLKPEVWAECFKTTDKATALSRFHRGVVSLNKNSPGTEIRARFDGQTFMLDYVTPATYRSPRRAGEALANSCLSYFLRRQGHEQTIELHDGHGELFAESVLDEVRECSEKVVMPIQWSRGDFVCIDNRTVMHGRRAFNDPLRSVYIRLGMEPPPPSMWSRMAATFKVVTD